jgi:predicted ArsR family transcriptional regulator
MAKKTTVEDPVEALTLLGEPKRRQLYDLVVARMSPVGRDEAAGTLGMSRELAAFHLDRLVDGGLLAAEYRRLGDRRGPGAGRPAKLYRRADRQLAVSFPPRRYDLAADAMATALDRLDGATGAEVAATVAHEMGTRAGAAALPMGGGGTSHPSTADLIDVLRRADYEPDVDASTGTLFLRNCPYHDLAAKHRDLTCGMNLAWAEGVIESMDVPLRAELEPEEGRCCVVFHGAPDGNAGEADDPAL